jgi:hypothetical protein
LTLKRRRKQRKTKETKGIQGIYTQDKPKEIIKDLS